MINLYDRVQPVAGPSTRRPRSASSTLGDSPCALGAECPLLPDVAPLAIQERTYRPVRRQDPASSSVSPSTETSSATSTSGLFPVPPPSSSLSSSDLFPVPTSTVNSETSFIANSTFSQESSTNYAYTPSSHSSHVYSSATSSFSQPWHTSARTPTPQVSQYVEGILLPMQLSGDSEDQAVYSVPMSFGHDDDGSDSGNQRRSYGNLRYKRGPSVDWQPGQPQILNLQVDLGSSDMWVASDTCTTSDCRSAPNLFNASESLDSGFETDFQYHRGEVSGNVYWEQIQLGGFGIGYQAFLAADEVSNENLAGGNFSGVLGLALPANSIILSDIAGSTTGNPDGATFLDNLFGSGLSAPSDKLFSLSLARREDVRTASSFGIGAISKALCPQPCKPTYIPIVSQPSLGAVGYLHWRIPLQGIIATTWADQRAGLGASQRNITLGSSQTSSGGSTPLAVLDSGGVQILVGHQPWVDAIYGAYGVQASSDGNYRMPCTTQLALSFVFGGKEYAVHPLDLSWPDPADPSQATCIGAIQYTSTLGQTGDFVLGSSFLKNVYSVFQYPDNDRRNGRIWQPTVGIVSLTNASVASQDFYAVRVQRQSLADVSANHPSGVENHPGDSGSETSGSNSPTEAPTSGKLLSTAGVAGISVLAFIVVAAGLFCAWWFWLRRKFGKQGVVVYPASKRRSKSSGNHSDTGTSSLRNRKHDATSRQKSMMEGFSDHEADSWMSTTEGDSIRLGYMPEVLGEEDDRNHGGMPESSRASSYRDTSADRKSLRDIRSSQAEAEGGDDINHSTPPVLAAAPTKARQSSPDVGTSRSRSSLAIPDSPSRYPTAYPYPTQGQISSHTPRSQSLSMSGPFPSANASRLSSLRPEASPMYDISTADYFAVPSVGSPRGRQARRLSPLPPSAKDTDVPAGESTLTGGPLVEEPDEAKKEARPLDPFAG